MKKVLTLKLNKEFKRAYYKGKFKAHPLLITYLVKSYHKKPRIGITASKKVGGAVQRNRTRRIIKQAFRELSSEITIKSNDYVFVARDKTKYSTTKDIKKIMKNQIEILQR